MFHLYLRYDIFFLAGFAGQGVLGKDPTVCLNVWLKNCFSISLSLSTISMYLSLFIPYLISLSQHLSLRHHTLISIMVNNTVSFFLWQALLARGFSARILLFWLNV